MVQFRSSTGSVGSIGRGDDVLPVRLFRCSNACRACVPWRISILLGALREKNTLSTCTRTYLVPGTSTVPCTYQSISISPGPRLAATNCEHLVARALLRT